MSLRTNEHLRKITQDKFHHGKTYQLKQENQILGQSSLCSRSGIEIKMIKHCAKRSAVTRGQHADESSYTLKKMITCQKFRQSVG